MNCPRLLSWGGMLTSVRLLDLPKRTPITSGIVHQITVIEFGIFAHLCRRQRIRSSASSMKQTVPTNSTS